MPPVRRRNAKEISNRNNGSRSTAANSDTESLPRHGQKNALISRLLQHANTSSSRPTVDATGNANLPST